MISQYFELNFSSILHKALAVTIRVLYRKFIVHVLCTVFVSFTPVF